MRMCVPTAHTVIDEQNSNEIRASFDKVRQSHTNSEQIDTKNLNIEDIIKRIKEGNSDPGEKKYFYVQNRGQIMIPVIQKHPMGNTAITNSFKPKETLRDRDLTVISMGDGVTPEASTNSKERHCTEMPL
jgi:hypothetical protein